MRVDVCSDVAEKKALPDKFLKRSAGALERARKKLFQSDQDAPRVQITYAFRLSEMIDWPIRQIRQPPCNGRPFVQGATDCYFVVTKFNADPHPTKGCTLVQFLAPESTSSRGIPAYPRNALACNRDA
jgi:hypothetical protein